MRDQALRYPEMKSTGECLGIATNFDDALYKAFLGAGIVLPKHKKMIISVKDADKEEMVEIARRYLKTKEDAEDIAQEGYSSEETVNEILDSSEKKILNIVKNRKSSEFRTIKSRFFLFNLP